MLRKTLHYIKYSLILRKELTITERKKFKNIEKNSIIIKPLKLVSGLKYVQIGESTTILKYARIQCYDEKIKSSPSIKIGDRCYIGFNFTILSGPGSSINIGNETLIASNVIITNINHGINPESDLSYMDQPLNTKSVNIEDGCWIGENVCILPGVTIGEKSVIGASSVVTHDIPAYSIAVGNPAKVIKKYNFNTHQWEKYSKL